MKYWSDIVLTESLKISIDFYLSSDKEINRPKYKELYIEREREKGVEKKKV